jgi:hypothetical protein
MENEIPRRCEAIAHILKMEGLDSSKNRMLAREPERLSSQGGFWSVFKSL